MAALGQFGLQAFRASLALRAHPFVDARPVHIQKGSHIGHPIAVFDASHRQFAALLKFCCRSFGSHADWYRLGAFK
jgi:hypothetical protein